MHMVWHNDIGKGTRMGRTIQAADEGARHVEVIEDGLTIPGCKGDQVDAVRHGKATDSQTS
jgi:hypothetical protein